MPKEFPWGKGTPKWERNATTNTSSKSFTVPTGKVWHLKYAYVEITTTATVGSRELAMYITNGTDGIFHISASTTTPASQKGTFSMQVNGFTSTAVPIYMLNGSTSPNTKTTVSIPEFILPAGYVVVLRDNAAIDANADDTIAVLHYVEYDV